MENSSKMESVSHEDGSKENASLVQDIMSQLEERNLLHNEPNRCHTGGLKETKSRSASMLQVLRKNKLKSAKKPRKSASLSLLCGLSRSKVLENLRKSGNLPKSRSAKGQTSTPSTECKEKTEQKASVFCALPALASAPDMKIDCSPIYQLAPHTADGQGVAPVHNVLVEAKSNVHNSRRSAMKYKGEEPGEAAISKHVRIRHSPETIHTLFQKASRDEKGATGLMRLDAGHTPRITRRKENFKESLI